MDLRVHLRIMGGALKRWFVAQSYDALAVGLMWLVGLLIIGVPGAPFWAALATVLQFIPNIGIVLALIGPSLTAVIAVGFTRLVYVLILYAVIVSVDSFVLQPYLMKRPSRVPIWASLLMPMVLGFFLSFWGVVISAPLLSFICDYRRALELAGEL